MFLDAFLDEAVFSDHFDAGDIGGEDFAGEFAQVEFFGVVDADGEHFGAEAFAVGFFDDIAVNIGGAVDVVDIDKAHATDILLVVVGDEVEVLGVEGVGIEGQEPAFLVMDIEGQEAVVVVLEVEFEAKEEVDIGVGGFTEGDFIGHASLRR